MSLHETVSRLRERYGSGDLLHPAYGDYCFANVPGTLGSLLGVDLGTELPEDVLRGVRTDVDHVLHVLADGFGLYLFRRDGLDYSLLRALADSGRVTPLTSTFPSATATAVTTVHTGRIPAEHGVVGGCLYLPDEGFVLQVLPFAVRGGPAGSAADRVSPDVVNDGPTVHERLSAAGVPSHVVQPASTVGTPYARATLAGSTRHPYGAVEAGVRVARRTVETASGPSHTYLYLPHVDTLSHEHGPDDDAYRAGLGRCCRALADELVALDPATARRTLVVLTADHGHVDIPWGSATDLLAFPDVRDGLRRDDADDPIPPTGGPRSVHLHCRPNRVEAVRETLARLDGRTFTREAALDDHALFGDSPGPRARRRCGDLVYVPRRGVAWYDDGTVTSKASAHGGLHDREMLVPFAAARAAPLVEELS